jgi:hypothetical protein
MVMSSQGEVDRAGLPFPPEMTRQSRDKVILEGTPAMKLFGCYD